MQTNKNRLDSIVSIFPPRVRLILQNSLRDLESRVQEIVIRTGRPVCIYINGEQLSLTSRGTLTRDISDSGLVRVSSTEMAEAFNSLCGYSVYSHINEIKEGFITLKGGHRVAISGTAVVSSGEILNIRDVSTISVRIAREVVGSAESVAKTVADSNGGLLICGAPVSGKTTVLRDLARLLSTKYLKRISLIDTRGELASVSKGIPQNDVGSCDILDGYPREKGIEQAVRCLSPQYIICDELGSKNDASAILSGLNSGVAFVATLHASSKDELLSKQNVEKILKTGAFSKVMFLRGRETPGVVEKTLEIGELLDA